MSAVPSVQSSMDDKGLIAYHVLRAAVEMFNQQPGALDAPQLQRATERAMQALALEDCVLGSDTGKRISVPEVAVDEAVEQIRTRYEDVSAFEQALLDSGVSVADLHRALWRELVFDAAINVVGDTADPVTDEEIEAFFAENPDRFHQPELRTVRHILITINDEYAENTAPQALRRISSIAEYLAEHPDEFEEQARQHSECPSALEGGLLGEVARGKLYPVLDKVLFELNERDVAGPLESETGYHLILCEAIRPGQNIGLNAVRDIIRDYLMDKKRKVRQKLWIQQCQAGECFS